MAEYIEREDALAKFRYSSDQLSEKIAYIRVEEVPAADVMPVVRCGECKHWKRIRNDCILASCELYALVRSEDFFCADGEKRDVEHD